MYICNIEKNNDMAIIDLHSKPFDEGTITGIINIENDENAKGAMVFDGKIYNMKGQVVSNDGDTSKLPKGVYITNGEKFVIK